ncbi:hypothetical protein ACI65C_002367 [Semiaphis heraclei]
MSTRPTPRPSVVSRGSSTPDDQRQHVRRGHASHDDDDDRCAPRVFRNDRLNPSRTRLLSLRPVFHHIGVSHAVRPSSFSRSDSSVAGGGGASSTGSGSYPHSDYHGGGNKTYRHKGRSKSATCKYVDDKPKKKKKSSTADSSSSSNSVSLASIPNTIKLSMLNSGLLPLCKLCQTSTSFLINFRFLRPIRVQKYTFVILYYCKQKKYSITTDK